MKKNLFTIAALVLLLSGCATKNYGRQAKLTHFEKSQLTCREIDIEISKVHGAVAQIKKESEFDGRSVLSFLGDFGIGNVIERSAATKSADARLAALRDLRSAQRCPVQADTLGE